VVISLNVWYELDIIKGSVCRYQYCSVYRWAECSEASYTNRKRDFIFAAFLPIIICSVMLGGRAMVIVIASANVRYFHTSRISRS